MIAKLENYLHYHLGAKCMVKVLNWDNTIQAYGQMLEANKKLVISTEILSEFKKGNIKVTPILRRIDSMSDKERFELDVYEHGILKKINKDDVILKRALVNAWYLENSFDIFGFINSGQAIDTEEWDTHLEHYK